MPELRPLLCLLALVATLTGCGWFGGEEADPVPSAEAAADVGGDASPPIPTEAVPSAPLELRLQPGERFPLLKTVEQTLIQETQAGPAMSRSRLELLLSIQVEESRADGGQRLSVQYHRVRYEHDVAGEIVSYDSATARAPVSPAVQPYHGLADNGFSFWLGPDNRIVELVGFQSFLEHCVRDVPVAQRQKMLSVLAETSGEEGIANFVDDSIGLLPFEAGSESTTDAKIVRVGDTWTREQRFLQPIPVYVSSRCTLKSLDDETADIDIVGTIATSTPFAPAHSVAPGTIVTVRGGNAFGTCRVRLATGLPIESRIERFFDMTVQAARGDVVEQRKRIVTTIRTYPQQSVVETAAAPQDANR